MNVLTPEGFRKQFQASLEGIPDDAVETAIDIVTGGDRLIPRRSAMQVVHTARQLTERATPNSPPVQDASARTGDDGLWEMTGPEAGLRSDQTAEAVRPEVEALRLHLFGTGEAPFSTTADAVAWIESDEVSGPPSPQAEERYMALVRSSGKELTKAGRAAGVSINPFGQPVGLPYVRSEKELEDERFRLVAGRPLRAPFWPLATTVESIAERTGFPPALVTRWILTGIKPRLRTFKLEQVTRIGGNSSVRIEFYSPDVTQKQILELFGKAKENWGSRRRKQARPKDVEFIGIVESAGGDWAQVLAECRSRPTQPDYEKAGWRGPYVRYRRLVERGLC